MPVIMDSQSLLIVEIDLEISNDNVIHFVQMPFTIQRQRLEVTSSKSNVLV